MLLNTSTASCATSHGTSPNLHHVQHMVPTLWVRNYSAGNQIIWTNFTSIDMTAKKFRYVIKAVLHYHLFLICKTYNHHCYV